MLWWLFSGWLCVAAQDVQQGETLAALSGCGSCHTAPEGEPYAGGHAIETSFGTFHGTNLSQSVPYGLGAWTYKDFERAMRHGRSPKGGPYFPAFPYPSFTKLTDADLRDLWAYLQTLPAVERPNLPHELRGITGTRFMVRFWKLMYFNPGVYRDNKHQDDAWNRGAYLVNGPAHCGECHTPRNGLGAMKRGQWMAGGDLPPEKGPNLTPTGLVGWSESELASYLEDGQDPEGDYAGSGMGRVIREGTSEISAEDRAAIATYIASLPPRGDAPEEKPAEPEDDKESWEDW